MNSLAQTFRWKSEKLVIFSDQALVSGSNFLLAAQLTGLLGLIEYGIFASQWLWVLFIMGLHQAFIQQPMFPLYFRTENGSDYLRSLVWTQLLTGSLLAIFSGCALSIITLSGLFYLDGWTLIQISSLLFFMSWHEFTRKYFLLRGEQKKLLQLDLLIFGSQPLIILLFPYLFGSAEQVWLFLCVVYAFSFLLTSLQLLYLPVRFSDVINTLFLHWKNGQFLVYTALLQWLSGNWFLVSGAALLSPGLFAIVRLSQTFTGLFTVFFQFMENTVPVEIGQALKNKPGMIGKITYSVARKYFPLLLSGLALLSIVILPLGTLLFGKEAVRIPVIPFLIIGLQLFVFAGTFIRFYLRFSNKNHLLFIGYTLCTVTSIIIAGPLIRKYGIYGLTSGLFIHQTIIYIPTLLTLKKRKS